MAPSPPARRTHRPLTVLALVLALAMGALEATVISTAMPSVVGDLGGLELYAWVTTAYLLTSSVTVPIYGKLADIYGRRPILLFGIAVFLLGSGACGVAGTMTQLIVFRAVQGVGAGAMQPIALTVIGDIFDLEERARIQGAFGAFWGLFAMIGPRVGGFCVDHLSWRWVFYLNIPFGILAAGLLLAALHERIEHRAHKLDYAGAALLALALVCLLLATSGAVPGAARWAGPAAVVLLAAFLAVERVAAEPMLPLPLFGRPVILSGSIIGAIIGATMTATLTFVPLLVQGVLHGDPTQAGSAFTPMLIGWPVASTLSGRLLPRFGFRPILRVGLLVTTLAALGLALVGGDHGLDGLRGCTALLGVGLGLTNTAVLIAVQTSVGWSERGVVTASIMFFRIIGGALAVSGMGGVLNATLAGDPSVTRESAARVLNPAGLRGIDPGLLDHAVGALARGVGWIFWLIVAGAVVALVTSLWFPVVPISPRTSAPAIPVE